jgi:hypothetical protein
MHILIQKQRGIRPHQPTAHCIARGFKRCTRCLFPKPLDKFGTRTDGAPRPWCKKCTRNYDRTRRMYVNKG